MNIQQSLLSQVKIMKLLHYGTTKLQQLEPYHATNLISHFEIEKEHTY